MPTGYTANIEKDISFEDYALSCALAFGACMHQRDASGQFKPKLRTNNDTYHIGALEQAKNSLIELEAMTNRDVQIEYGNKIIAKKIADCLTMIEKNESLRVKYQKMMERVRAWKIPTEEHSSLKQFMMDQIYESLKWDCNSDYEKENLAKLERLEPLDVFNDALSGAHKEVACHSTGLSKSIEKDHQANKWIIALYDSLGVSFDADI